MFKTKSRLLLLMNQVENKLGVCVAFVLAWMMKADGSMSTEELDVFNKVVIDYSAYVRNELLEIIDAACADDIAIACVFLSKKLHDENKVKFLELAILMMISDGLIHFSEQMILYLLADVLGFSERETKQIFENFTKKKLPPLPDLSDKQWWQSNENKSDFRNNNGKSSQSAGATLSRRLKALAMLGLDENATMGDICAAYRRMVQVHHPDKFDSLGPEAVKAANESFQRIQNSYDYLRSNL